MEHRVLHAVAWRPLPEQIPDSYGPDPFGRVQDAAPRCIFCKMVFQQYEFCVVGSVAYEESGKGPFAGLRRCDVAMLEEVHDS